MAMKRSSKSSVEHAHRSRKPGLWADQGQGSRQRRHVVATMLRRRRDAVAMSSRCRRGDIVVYHSNVATALLLRAYVFGLTVIDMAEHFEDQTVCLYTLGCAFGHVLITLGPRICHEKYISYFRYNFGNGSCGLFSERFRFLLDRLQPVSYSLSPD